MVGGSAIPASNQAFRTKPSLRGACRVALCRGMAFAPNTGESGRADVMKDILDKLEKRRGEARLGGGEKPHRGPAQARQTDRARAHRTAARQGLVRGARHVRPAPLVRLRHGEDQNPRRRRRHRLGHGQRPHGLSVLQGLHRVRRLAVGSARPEDHEGAGHGDEGARAGHRPVRRRRRPHPGGRRGARRLWRGVQAQRAGLAASFRRSASSWGLARAATSIRRP